MNEADLNELCCVPNLANWTGIDCDPNSRGVLYELSYRQLRYLIYAGTVMTSFNYITIPTRSNWFQTNPQEHESDDRADNAVSSVCVTNGKDMALHRQIWSTFVTVLWLRKAEIQDRAGILVLVVFTIFNIYW